MVKRHLPIIFYKKKDSLLQGQIYDYVEGDKFVCGTISRNRFLAFVTDMNLIELHLSVSHLSNIISFPTFGHKCDGAVRKFIL